MKYFIQIFGCQMNISDAQRIAGLFESRGIKEASTAETANIFVVVMCSVRQMAADRVFGLEQKFKLIRQSNPEFRAILTGCVVESDKPRFAEIFDHIFDIKTLSRWPKILHLTHNEPREGLTFASLRRLDLRDYFVIPPKQTSKFSALVPISKGCDNYCSYCVVPYTRGPLAGRPAEDILAEIESAVKNGAKEIWLLGQNVNNYHFQGIDFAKLLRAANEIPGDFWLRFTSPHPKDFDSNAVLAMAQCQKVTPYLNLPVQSGDNHILKAMKRPYTAARYKALVKKIRAAFKKYRRGLEREIAISTDVIVGFCDETEKEFQNTVRIFKEIKYDMAYISRYSRRPGTAAAAMSDNVSEQEKKRRENILNDIVKITALAHNKKWRGKTVDVLVDCVKNGFAFGKDRHYKTVKFAAGGNNIAPGDMVKVKVVKVMPFGLMGKIQK
jgi:tRNA-2-methylthio-N6-dimethylallyladenosine synthase